MKTRGEGRWKRGSSVDKRKKKRMKEKVEYIGVITARGHSSLWWPPLDSSHVQNIITASWIPGVVCRKIRQGGSGREESKWWKGGGMEEERKNGWTREWKHDCPRILQNAEPSHRINVTSSGPCLLVYVANYCVGNHANLGKLHIAQYDIKEVMENYLSPFYIFLHLIYLGWINRGF